MGANYYFRIDKREEIKKAVDEFDFERARELMKENCLHICKCSAGWLPLFQTQPGKFTSVREIKEFYELNKPAIVDEYERELSWEEFEKDVINHNGGVKGKVKPKKIKTPKDSAFYDKDMPDYTPISHFDYGNGKYNYMYRKDKDGHEFTDEDFY